MRYSNKQYRVLSSKSSESGIAGQSRCIIVKLIPFLASVFLLSVLISAGKLDSFILRSPKQTPGIEDAGRSEESVEILKASLENLVLFPLADAVEVMPEEILRTDTETVSAVNEIPEDGGLSSAIDENAFYFPVSGKVLNTFGEGFDHITGISYYSEGIDIGVDKGTPVLSSRSGRVLRTGHHASYGLYVLMRHENAWSSLYGNLGRVDVSPGDDIEAQQFIGISGQSGIARNPQVHFALIHNDMPMDPLNYLN